MAGARSAGSAPLPLAIATMETMLPAMFTSSGRSFSSVVIQLVEQPSSRMALGAAAIAAPPVNASFPKSLRFIITSVNSGQISRELIDVETIGRSHLRPLRPQPVLPQKSMRLDYVGVPECQRHALQRAPRDAGKAVLIVVHDEHAIMRRQTFCNKCPR